MSFARNFWQSIERIQCILNIDDQELAKLINRNHFELIADKTCNRPLNMFELATISNKFGLTIDGLVHGQFDDEQIINNYHNLNPDLPNKYKEGKLSRLRTLINVLDYTALKLGDECRQFLLQKLGVNEKLLNNPNKFTNIHLITDLCRHLKTVGLTKEDFINMGKYSYETNKNTDFGILLSKFNSAKNLYKFLLEDYTHMYDKNFKYQVTKVDNSGLVLETTFSEEALDTYRVKNFGNSTTCLTKIGVLSSMSQYIGLAPSPVKKTHCIYQGDTKTRYEISFPIKKR